VRVLVAILTLFPVLAGAQELGLFQITGGDISVESGGEIFGNGFTGGVGGGPELLSGPGQQHFYGGGASLSFCFGCGLPGTDAGVGSLVIAGLNDPALAGLVQVRDFDGPVESGELLAGVDDVTGAGIYSAPFTLSADLAYGLPNATVPEGYVDFVGHGTVTLDVAPAQCRKRSLRT
jgi:hypothetical protein